MLYLRGSFVWEYGMGKAFLLPWESAIKCGDYGNCL